jgi:hypothetical protein
MDLASYEVRGGDSPSRKSSQRKRSQNQGCYASDYSIPVHDSNHYTTNGRSLFWFVVQRVTFFRSTLLVSAFHARFSNQVNLPVCHITTIICTSSSRFYLSSVYEESLINSVRELCMRRHLSIYTEKPTLTGLAGMRHF